MTSINVTITDWQPTQSFDWDAFFASAPQIEWTPRPTEPEFVPGIVTAPDDPESGWNPETSVFITNDQGYVADFNVVTDDTGQKHYEIPDGTDAVQTAWLRDAFSAWLD